MGERGAVDDDWHRCFIALEPDAATRDALAALAVGPSARRVPIDQLHMTMAFLGSVAPEKGAALAQRLSSVATPLPPQRAERSEYWPSAARPRLVVVPFGPAHGLAEIEARIRALLAALGLPVDTHRPFRPHVTLARFARSTHLAGPAREAAAGRAFPQTNLPPGGAMLEVVPRFEALTLYSSTLARHGARYRSLASVPVPHA
ncbi:RNA 2',3'-cyclic phosphodiesterase [Trinickia diaoshuihuensis]|jgi:2'-5' RNA ligase|uniref:RNA 2',3'-cyclic phosphodiesterase n=1 Tax=Trinickia diaoshuihuensis TaxID=2292265 RepID=UPI000E22DFD1|nr:RNA 2',3'-cyclic phosphodiesterase [Trinickia diaoshuihuensis]